MSATTIEAVRPGSAALFVCVLGALVAFAPLTIDMYLPALPAIAADFQAGSGAVQATLALYFIGMALGQLVYGPLSDRYGRKAPLYAGFLLYALASAGCALAPNIATLQLCRLLQALGGCAGAVIPLAVVRDHFGKEGSARALSRLMLVMGAAPMLAPAAGAVLLEASGWRAIFWALLGCGLAALAMLRWVLPETLAPQQRQAVSFRGTFATWRALLGNRKFAGNTLAGALAGAGMFAYIAGSPFVLINLHGLTPQHYGWVFGINACGLIGASQLNHRLLGSYRSHAILSVALLACALSGLALLAVLAAQLATGLLLVVLFLFVALMGLIFPNSAAGAMSAAGERAGNAAALLGTVRFGAATAAGGMVAAFAHGGGVAMGAVMAACGIGAWWSLRMDAEKPRCA
jgi:DHA1 family bicyclomycin/chloramphenicol resistance-like MFS transporter